MRRLWALPIAVALVVGGLVLPTPPDLDPEVTASTVAVEDVLELTRFLHCPWALADGRRQSSYALLSTVDADYAISFPENGEVTDGLSGAALRGSAIAIDNDRVIGTSSAVVEFSDGPAAAAVVALGEGALAGDLCPGTLPGLWHVPGGSTREGETLTLRLFNPFADDARVDLAAASEFGTEANDSFQAVSIPARSTRTVDLNVIFPGRETLSVFVERIEGSVIPLMVQETATDIAVWPGTRHSEAWEFPLGGTSAIATTVVMTNFSPIDVSYTVEIFDERASVLAAETGVIDGLGQAAFVLDDVETDGVGLRLTGDGPFGAVVVGRSDDTVAAAVGASTSASEWLIPGPNSETLASYQLWLLNTGVEPVAVTYRKANATGGGPATTVAVEAGALLTVDVTDIGTNGIVASGTGPFTAAWSARAGSLRMFGGAAPIGQ